MRTCPPRQLLRAAMAGLLGVALALPARAAPPPNAPASAEVSANPPIDHAEALRLFRAAVALYNADEFLEAALRFEASFAATPSPEAAYNAAFAHERAGDRVATLGWLRRYLAIAQRDTDTSYPLALQRAEDLGAQLGELSLRIDQLDGLREVRVNELVVALHEFPLLLEPGLVELRFIGDRPEQLVKISTEVPAGGPATIHFPGFRLAPSTPAEPAPVAEPVAEPVTDARQIARHRQLRGLFWAGAGLTAASAVAIGALGGLTLRAESDYVARYIPNFPTGEADANQAAQRHFHDLRLATNVMIGVAASLAVITLALGIVTLQRGRSLRTSARAGRLRLGASGLQLSF